MNKKLPLLLLLIAAVFSCKKKSDTTNDITWIGGQIVNPQMDYVIIAQGNRVMDTIKLNSKNFFLYKTSDLKSGLYTLRHNETQVFYIEPGDSLLIHLNTLEFDESLAYSGRGGAQNNLLMDLFLKNEKENKLIPSWYTLPPEEFTRKIDSLEAEKWREYQDFISENEVSEGFKEAAEASIKYDYFSKKEMYGMANRRRLENLGDDFYAYRKDIDFGNENLRFYYPYYRFLIRYFDNLMIAKFPFGTERSSYDFNAEKLKAIDSLSQNDSIRNSLSRYTALRYYFSAKDQEEQKRFYQLFEKVNNNPKHQEEIRKLSESTIRLTQGNQIPNVLLLTMDNTMIPLRTVLHKPTVLYFWSGKSPEQAKIIHNRKAELKSKYPEYDFLGINTDSHFRKWRNTVRKMGYDPSAEFQLENVKEGERALVLSSTSKSIIVDSTGVILDGNANMFNSDFEELLLGYLNR